MKYPVHYLNLMPPFDYENEVAFEDQWLVALKWRDTLIFVDINKTGAAGLVRTKAEFYHAIRGGSYVCYTTSPEELQKKGLVSTNEMQAMKEVLENLYLSYYHRLLAQRSLPIHRAIMNIKNEDA